MKIAVVPSHRHAALWALTEPLCRHLGWFGFFLMLAPIVGPHGYGVFVLALSGVAIAEALLAASAIQVLVDLRHVDERHWSTALAAVVGAGAAMSLALYAAAGCIATMLDDAPLANIFQSLTMLPLLGALAVVPTARLRREARQTPLAVASIFGLACGGGVAIALAWAGAGSWSLVAQILVHRFIECAVLWVATARWVGAGWSRRHFAELTAGLDLRALAAAWPALARHGPCLLVGLSLGPIAAALYMIAARGAEALGDIALAPAWSRTAASATDLACHAGFFAFPAVLTSAALGIILPWALDARWWGAVPAARILAISVIPAVVMRLPHLAARNPAATARWQAAQGIGGLAAVAFAAPYGLAVVAGAVVAQAAAFALFDLWLGRQHGSPIMTEAVRPLAGACAAGLLLFVLTEPVAVALTPIPALCLLAGSSRLCYCLVRGRTGDEGAAAPAAPTY